jgi:hypothetical protein
MLMEAHLTERQDTDLWKYHQNHVVTPLSEQIKKTNFDPDIDETVLHKICGILDVNTFEIRGDAAEDGVRFGQTLTLKEANHIITTFTGNSF